MPAFAVTESMPTLAQLRADFEEIKPHLIRRWVLSDAWRIATGSTSSMPAPNDLRPSELAALVALGEVCQIADDSQIAPTFIDRAKVHFANDTELVAFHKAFCAQMRAYGDEPTWQSGVPTPLGDLIDTHHKHGTAQGIPPDTILEDP